MDDEHEPEDARTEPRDEPPKDGRDWALIERALLERVIGPPDLGTGEADSSGEAA
jgi:hypothetical protein